jgi:hypothetical protein
VRKNTLIALLLAAMLVAFLAPPAAAAADNRQQIRFKGKVRWVESLATYALLADDGKKYHPVKQLPRAYQKNDLAVVVDGVLRPELVGSRMYGPALDVQQITRADKYVSPEEWEAVRLLLLRIQAFNEKDLGKLQAIDAMAGKLTPAQFASWLEGWGSFTLHYVEAVNIFGPRPTGPTIEGICLYSRARVNSMAISGDVQFAVMKFTLAKNGDNWRFTAMEPYRPDPDKDITEVAVGYLEKAKERFGTTDLAAAKK